MLPMLHQDGNSPVNHGRFFIFGVFAVVRAYLNKGGSYRVRWDHIHQINSLRFIYFFKGVFND